MNIYKTKLFHGHASPMFVSADTRAVVLTETLFGELSWVHGHVIIHEFAFKGCVCLAHNTSTGDARSIARRTDGGFSVMLRRSGYNDSISMSYPRSVVYIESNVVLVIDSGFFVYVIHKGAVRVRHEELIALRAFLNAQEAITLFVKAITNDHVYIPPSA